jgi:hypothetical protein
MKIVSLAPEVTISMKAATHKKDFQPKLKNQKR